MRNLRQTLNLSDVHNLVVAALIVLVDQIFVNRRTFAETFGLFGAVHTFLFYYLSLFFRELFCF